MWPKKREHFGSPKNKIKIPELGGGRKNSGGGRYYLWLTSPRNTCRSTSSSRSFSRSGFQILRYTPDEKTKISSSSSPGKIQQASRCSGTGSNTEYSFVFWTREGAKHSSREAPKPLLHLSYIRSISQETFTDFHDQDEHQHQHRSQQQRQHERLRCMQRRYDRSRRTAAFSLRS